MRHELLMKQQISLNRRRPRCPTRIRTDTSRNMEVEQRRRNRCSRTNKPQTWLKAARARFTSRSETGIKFHQHGVRKHDLIPQQHSHDTKTETDRLWNLYRLWADSSTVASLQPGIKNNFKNSEITQKTNDLHFSEQQVMNTNSQQQWRLFEWSRRSAGL